MIIAGTGHRPDKLGGYSKEAFDKLVLLAEGWLGSEGKDCIKVVSGMALGWDQALVQAAINLNIPVLAAIPFIGQESKWPAESQKYYQELLDKCSEKVYVNLPGYAAWKMQKRNEWMANYCDVILALFDGSQGGTANCIKYAEKKNKRVINLYNQFKTL